MVVGLRVGLRRPTYSLTQIFPYVNQVKELIIRGGRRTQWVAQMIEELSIAKDVKDVGFYSGLVVRLPL